MPVSTVVEFTFILKAVSRLCFACTPDSSVRVSRRVGFSYFFIKKIKIHMIIVVIQILIIMKTTK